MMISTPFIFFVNDVQFESPSVLPTLAGWQIREIAKIPGDYTLKMMHSDLVIGDNNAINLDQGEPPRLWMVPHATY